MSRYLLCLILFISSATFADTHHWGRSSIAFEPILEAKIGEFKFKLEPKKRLIIQGKKSSQHLWVDISGEHIYSLFPIENLLFLVGEDHQLYLLDLPQPRTFIGRRFVKSLSEKEPHWLWGKWLERYQIDLINIHDKVVIGHHQYQIFKHYFDRTDEGYDIILKERLDDQEFSVRQLLKEQSETCTLLLRGKI